MCIRDRLGNVRVNRFSVTFQVVKLLGGDAWIVPWYAMELTDSTESCAANLCIAHLGRAMCIVRVTQSLRKSLLAARTMQDAFHGACRAKPAYLKHVCGGHLANSIGYICSGSFGDISGAIAHVMRTRVDVA